MKSSITLSFVAALGLCCCTPSYDIVIAGGSASGVTAAIQASRMGAKVLIIEETPWVGGMLTSAGVSAFDGNYSLRGGLFGEFCDSLASHYGGYEALKTGWVSNILFEPKVGEEIFEALLAKGNVEVARGSLISSAHHRSGQWQIEFHSSPRGSDPTSSLRGCEAPVAISKAPSRPSRVKAKVLIDCTELGDIAAMLRVPYSVGMDARKDCGEAIAPQEKNNIIQDLTYVITAQDYPYDVTIPCPEGYDKSLYEGCVGNPWSADMMLSYGRLPGGKYMLNWPISGNDCYVNPVEATPEERALLYRHAKNVALGYLYYIQTELGYSHIGIAHDEYPTEDGLPLIPYHRESRRIDGQARFSINDVTNPYRNELYKSSIAVGDYAVDHHHRRYEGPETLPDLHFYPVPSFSVPLGTMLPASASKLEGSAARKTASAGTDQSFTNLIVAEKSISVTNIMNGATRLQPVVMELGQAAGTLAAIAVETHKDVDEVPVREVQRRLLEDGAYLLPYNDLPPSDPHFKALQRAGLSGVLRGEGRHEGWTNFTSFRAEDPLYEDELYLDEIGCGALGKGSEEKMDEAESALSKGSESKVDEAESALGEADEAESAIGGTTSREHKALSIKDLFEIIGGKDADRAQLWVELGLSGYDPDRPITRLEAAVVIDHLLAPFDGNL